MHRLQILALLACLCIVFLSSSFQVSESPLSKLMREMTHDMKKLRSSTVQGKTYTKWGKTYERILTAKPSADSKKGDHFEEYAKLFLVQVERTKAANQTETFKTEYNLLIGTCIRCHQTYCPGPITMLKKMKVPL